MSEADWSGVELCLSESSPELISVGATTGEKRLAKPRRKKNSADDRDELAQTRASTKFVLIDYENVQPTDLAQLYEGSFKVIVFIGANQTKIPVTFAAAVHRLGVNAQYVIAESAGPNALDFYIAYYVGLLIAQEPSASIHVISKDTGFDPLIQHVHAKNVRIERCPSISHINGLNSAAANLQTETLIESVLLQLGKIQKAKPRTKKTLLNMMRSLFKNELTEIQISDLFDRLCEQGIVEEVGNRISYQMASET